MRLFYFQNFTNEKILKDLPEGQKKIRVSRNGVN